MIENIFICVIMCRMSCSKRRKTRRMSVKGTCKKNLGFFRPDCHPPTRNTCVINTPWYRDPIHHLPHGQILRQRRRHLRHQTFRRVANCWPVSPNSENIWRSCRFLRTARDPLAITTTIREPFCEIAATSRTSKSRGSKWGRNNVHELCLPGEFSKTREKGIRFTGEGASHEIIQTLVLNGNVPYNSLGYRNGWMRYEYKSLDAVLFWFNTNRIVHARRFTFITWFSKFRWYFRV